MVFGEISVHEATGRIVTPKVAGSEILREHRAGATLWIVPACWRPLPRMSPESKLRAQPRWRGREDLVDPQIPPGA
jgi:hypothetical protein